MTKEYSDFLAHYGVKGQKWGRRQYQNEDGSYTQAGAERYWGGWHGRQPGMGTAPMQQVRAPGRVPSQRASDKPKRHDYNRDIKKMADRLDRESKAHFIMAGVGALALGAIVGTTALRNRVRAKEAARFLKTASYRPVNQSVNSNALGRVFKSAHGQGYHGKLFNEQSQRFMNAGLNRINNINRRQAFGIAARDARERAGEFFRRRLRR